MDRFFVGQRVRVVRSYDCPWAVGSEAIIVGALGRQVISWDDMKDLWQPTKEGVSSVSQS